MMSLALYFLCGVPWSLYCAGKQLKNPPADHVMLRLVLSLLLNVVFWPLAQVIAAVREV